MLSELWGLQQEIISGLYTFQPIRDESTYFHCILITTLAPRALRTKREA